MVDLDLEDWDRDMRINVTSMMLMARYAIPEMRKQNGGAIVNIASVAGLRGGHTGLMYPTSKGAVVNMTRAMAVHHGREGIRVNCVNPGTADTPWVARLLDKAADPAAERAALEARQPSGRLVTPQEVADAVLYLAGPHAGATTGTSLAVDGGMAGLRVRPR